MKIITKTKEEAFKKLPKKEKFRMALLKELCKEDVFPQKYRVMEVEKIDTIDFINHTYEPIEEDNMECGKNVRCKCFVHIKTKIDNESTLSSQYYADIDVKIISYSCEYGFTLEILNTPISLRDRF